MLSRLIEAVYQYYFSLFRSLSYVLKLLTQEYNNGKKTADALLKVAVAERVSGGYRIYNLGTGRNLAAKYASLNSQGGHKIAKLTGVQIA